MMEKANVFHSKQPYTPPYSYTHIFTFIYNCHSNSSIKTRLKDYISQSGYLSRWISHVSIRIVQTEYIHIQPQKAQLGTKDALSPLIMNSESDPLPPQNDPPSDPPPILRFDKAAWWDNPLGF